MNRSSRIAKRLTPLVVLVAALVVVQVVLAAPPVATFDFVGPNGTTTCGLWTFTSGSTDPDNDIATTVWDIAGTAATGAAATANFTTPGPRTIGMSVTDGLLGDGDLGEETVAATPQTVTVTNTAPTAMLTVPSAAQLLEPVTFSALGSNDPDTGPLTYQWDVGSGFDATLTGNSVTLAQGYPTAGLRTIRVRVTDACGTQDEAVGGIFVSNTGPQADLVATPNPVGVGTSVTFNASGSKDLGVGGSIVKYEWDLDGVPGFELTGTTPTMSRAYTSAGTVIAQVRVTDNDGGTATTFVPVTVRAVVVPTRNAPPVASFRVAPASPLEGTEVSFLSTASDPEGRLASQKWDLDNDGRFDDADGPVVSKVMKKGSHLVRLRVTDAAGAAAASTQTVNVRPKPLRNPPDVQSSVRYSPRSWGIVVSRFSVKVPSRMKLAVSCKGRGCPHGTFRKRSKKKAALLVFPQVKGSLRAGAKITLIFTRPGYITGWDTITIRGGNRQTVLREGCKIRSAKKQKRCP